MKSFRHITRNAFYYHVADIQQRPASIIKVRGYATEYLSTSRLPHNIRPAYEENVWVPPYVFLPASKISGASILFLPAGIVRILNVIIFRLTRSYRGLLAAVMYTPAHIIYLRHIKKMSEFHFMSSFRLQRYPVPVFYLY